MPLAKKKICSVNKAVAGKSFHDASSPVVPNYMTADTME